MMFPFYFICMGTNLAKSLKKISLYIYIYFLEAVTCKKDEENYMKDQPFSIIYIIFKEQFH